MTAPWPETQSRERPGETLREILDYVIWICGEMLQLGYHSGSDRDFWVRRVQTAYTATFLPMLPGNGDPYPPDVPPAKNPGIWPDVPSSGIPGMTLRHQLVVLRLQAERLRARVWPHARPHEIDEWDRRLSKAREALDHGPDVEVPEDARTEPSSRAHAEAEKNRAALQAKARQRALDLRRRMRERKKAAAEQKKAAKKAPVKKKTAKRKTTKKKAVKKKTAKRKTTKKKAVKKKTAKRKTTKKKAVKKKTAKRKTTKKKAAKKKTAKRKTAKKKAAKKKTAKRKTAKKKTRRR